MTVFLARSPVVAAEAAGPRTDDELREDATLGGLRSASRLG